MNYLEIILDKRPLEQRKSNYKILTEKILTKILSCLFPNANPDFEEEISTSYKWWIEFDEFGTPIREIGFNNQNNPIVILPFQNNFGFWTDEDLIFSDFIKSFNQKVITSKQFREVWQKIQSEKVCD